MKKKIKLQNNFYKKNPTKIEFPINKFGKNLQIPKLHNNFKIYTNKTVLIIFKPQIQKLQVITIIFTVVQDLVIFQKQCKIIIPTNI